MLKLKFLQVFLVTQFNSCHIYFSKQSHYDLWFMDALYFIKKVLILPVRIEIMSQSKFVIKHCFLLVLKSIHLFILSLKKLLFDHPEAELCQLIPLLMNFHLSNFDIENLHCLLLMHTGPYVSGVKKCLQQSIGIVLLSYINILQHFFRGQKYVLNGSPNIGQ